MALDDPIVFLLVFFFLVLVMAIVAPRSGIRGVLLVGGVWMFIIVIILLAISLHFLFGLTILAIGAAVLIYRSRLYRKETGRFGDQGIPRSK